MKNILFLTLLSASVLANAQSQTSVEEDLSGSYELIEYYFESVEGNTGPVHCVEEEIIEGLQSSFYSEPDDQSHSLDPSYQPARGKGAWLVSQESCPSQRPYYNGVGFESLDKTNGVATIYIAAFQRKPSQGGPGFDRAMNELMRGYDVINLETRQASCRIVGRSYLIVGAKILVCELEEDQGYIKFRKY